MNGFPTLRYDFEIDVVKTALNKRQGVKCIEMQMIPCQTKGRIFIIYLKLS